MLKTQKELKTEYTEQLAKAWDSPTMIKYCANSAAYIVEYDNKLFAIEKPKIKTKFCYGFGFCGISSEQEEETANAMARRAESDVDYFKNENLRELNEKIATLAKIAEEMELNWAEGGHPHYMIATNKRYYGQDEDCKLRGFSVYNTFDPLHDGAVLCYDVELVRALVAGYQEARKAFTKRIDAYLKRYGLTKVESWSYLSD